MNCLIVDDSTLVVERVRALMSNIEGLEFIGRATNANDAVEAIERLKPDVMILDIRLNGARMG
jgi:DNA-binding NarL/FixJ family response regulator